MNPLTYNTMDIKKSQKKGRNNYIQTCRLPGIMANIFADILPSLATEKKALKDVSGHTVNVQQKPGRPKR